MILNALKISEASSDEMLSNEKQEPIGIICIKIRAKAITITTKYDDNNKFLFLFGKSTVAIKRIVIGRRPKARNFDRTDPMKETEDKGHVLKIKYNENR